MSSPRAIVRMVLTVVAVAAALGLLYLLRDVVALVLIATFVAVALGPAVDVVDHRRIPRGLAIVLVYAAILLVLVGVGLVIVPPVVDEVDAFVGDIPAQVDRLRASPTIARYDNRYGVTEALSRQAMGLPERLGQAVGALQSVTVGVFSTLFQLVTILVIAFFLLLDGQRLLNVFFHQLAPHREQEARAAAARVYRAVGGYVTGAFSIALAAGVSTYVVLELLGVPFAVPLAVLMALLDLIPLVGASIAGALIAFAITFQDFPYDLIVWAIFFLVYQQLENNVLQPFVYRRTVELSGLLVIIAVLCGGALLGVLGALLAIPVAATIQILLQTYGPASLREPGPGGPGPPGDGPPEVLDPAGPPASGPTSGAEHLPLGNVAEGERG